MRPYFQSLCALAIVVVVAGCGDDDKKTSVSETQVPLVCPAKAIDDVIAAKPKPRPPLPQRVTITNLAPDHGGEGAAVTIFGPDFGSRNRPGSVFFGEVTAQVYSWAPTQVVTRVPAGLVADVYGVRVSVPNRGFSNNISFAVQPVITALMPLEAAAGGTITVTGTGFGPDQDTLLIDCAPVTPTAWSPTAITFTVPQLASAVTASVVVQVNDISSEPASFRYIGGTQPQDTWYPMAVTDMYVPAGIAVWTGTEMLVFANADFARGPEGGLYNPATDTWRSISDNGAPPYTTLHGVWAPERHELITISSNGTTTRYAPQTDQWFAASATGGPTSEPANIVWTGTEMLAWGQFESFIPSNSGFRYDPAAERWASMTTEGAPAWRNDATAVWTGDEMLIWGGELHDAGLTNTGARYNPGLNQWAGMTTAAAPAPRFGFPAVWTGNEMIVWGGNSGGVFLNTGGRYDPINDLWEATNPTGVPQARAYHSAVWTGTEMIVWGGQAALSTSPQNAGYGQQGGTAVNFLNSGAKYSPVGDSWQPTSLLGAPAPRIGHFAVWDGTEMIIWGGRGYASTNNGGRYRP